MDAAEVIRMVNVGIRLIVLALCAAAWVRRPKVRLWVVAPATWTLPGLVYYGFLFTGCCFSAAAMDRFAAAMGLSGALLIFGATWFFLWPARGRG